MSTLIATTLQGINTIKYDASTTAMTIDSGGRVKMPNQVLFQAVSETVDGSGFFISYAVDSSSDGYTMNLTNIGGILNIGGHFNTSTGVFTAPIAGIYELHFGFASRDGAAGRKIGQMYKNGNFVSEVVELQAAYGDAGRTIYADLSANDTIQAHTNGTYNFETCSFSGRLIQ